MQNSLSSDLIRGHIDTIILKILSEEDTYGYKIFKSIFEITEHQYGLKETSLYSALKRLENENYITSYWGDETQGGRRKYYKITAEGLQKFENNILEWNLIKSIMDKIIQ